MNGNADLRHGDDLTAVQHERGCTYVGPQEREAGRQGFARGWRAAVLNYLPTQAGAQIERPARDKVAQIGAALDAARNDPVELTRIRQEHRLHPYAPTCTPACRMGAW